MNIGIFAGAHDHVERKLGVSYATRDYIIKLLSLNKMKPATILQNIVRDAEREKLEIPLIKDVYNFLNTLQKKTVGKSNMTLGELAKFCIEHDQIPDEDSPHEPFVLDFQIFDEDDIDTLVDFEEDDQFRVYLQFNHLSQYLR